MKNILTIVGAALSVLWGTAHLFPLKGVIKEFGDISTDNKNILAMEWINEGLTLIFLGVLIITSIIVSGSPVEYINILVAVMLIAMAVVSLFTGFKVNFIPYKLCPFIFTVSAILLIIPILI